MAKNIRQLKHKVDDLPARERTAIRKRARDELDREIEAHERGLGELRHARSLTQVQLAKSLGVTQAQVSRIENQADLYLSTLASYVEAMGGELQIAARFESGSIPLIVGEIVEAQPKTRRVKVEPIEAPPKSTQRRKGSRSKRRTSATGRA